jgi:sugar phosphate isomerase/epimerase
LSTGSSLWIGEAEMPVGDAGRLIGSTVGFGRLDVEAAAEVLVELGFEATEVHLLQLGPGIGGALVFEGHAAALGESLQEAGLVVSTLNGAGAAGFEPLVDRETWDEAASELGRQLRLASALGSPRLLCWDGRLPPNGDAEAAPRLLADCIAAGVERSALSDPPVVSVELHPFTFALEHHLVPELVAALRDVGAGICLDFCHFGVALGPAFLDELDAEALASINHIHFADSDCVTSELHFPPGKGILDLPAIVSRLSGLGVALAWDLYGWPAPRAAIRRHMPVYAGFVRGGGSG